MTISPLKKSKTRTKSPTNHHPKAAHVSLSAVNQSLEDLGVDKMDVDAINNITKGVPSKTRHLKENTFTTIANINEKWSRHKSKTNEIINKARLQTQKEMDKNKKLNIEITQKELENDRLKSDVNRLEEIIEELTLAKKNEARASREKELLSKEMDSLKLDFEKHKHTNLVQAERIRCLDSENTKLNNEHSKLKKHFKRMENKANTLESELKETKVELEMFEEMLSAIPKGDETFSSMTDFNDINTSFSPIKDNAARGVCDGEFEKPVKYKHIDLPSSRNGPLLQPAMSSTPLVSRENLPNKKLSATTALNSMARQHQESQKLCESLAREAAEMKIRDQELSRLLNDSQ